MGATAWRKLLKKVNVLNYDDGQKFTDISRLDTIDNELRESSYHRVNDTGLFYLYAKKSLEQMKEPLLVISSHIDCQHAITKCFSEVREDGTLKGTYDNSITNTAVLGLMKENRLADNVVIAFTGDEEENSFGAISVVNYLREKHKKFIVIVLDVTDMGWEQKADFTIENDFWDEKLGMQVISILESIHYNWRYIPSDPDDIPKYIPRECVINVEAEADESWAYDEENVSCFSLCIPTKGPMHSNRGVLARQKSFLRYTEVLEQIANQIGLKHELF